MFEAYSICSSGVKDECEVLPFCLTSPLTVRRRCMNQIHVVAHEGARHEAGPHRREIVVALAVSQSERQSGPVGADLQVAGGDVVSRHEGPPHGPARARP